VRSRLSSNSNLFFDHNPPAPFKLPSWSKMDISSRSVLNRLAVGRESGCRYSVACEMLMMAHSGRFSRGFFALWLSLRSHLTAV
jgi:hypothetical protein